MSTETLEILSPAQREKLLTFIHQSAVIIGDEALKQHGEWTDASLLVTSLRVAQLLGYEGHAIEELFRCEFGLIDVIDDMLADWLGFIRLVDVERRIRVACGGVS